MTVRSVQEARDLHEQHKDRWTAIVREAILDTFRGHSTFHSDALEPLGIPDEHRAVIGSQVAKLVNQHWIEEIDRRKSKLPSRNAAKSGVYQLTPLGRMKIVGVGGEETPATEGHPSPSAPGPRRSPDPGEPVPLFEPPAPRPLSAFTDPGAA